MHHLYASLVKSELSNRDAEEKSTIAIHQSTTDVVNSSVQKLSLEELLGGILGGNEIGTQPNACSDDDYLTALMGPEDIGLSAQQIRENVKARLIERGTQIEKRLVDEQEQLKERRLMVQAQGGNIGKEEEVEFENYQSVVLFRISLLEQRLARHETQAADILTKLERK